MKVLLEEVTHAHQRVLNPADFENENHYIAARFLQEFGGENAGNAKAYGIKETKHAKAIQEMYQNKNYEGIIQYSRKNNFLTDKDLEGLSSDFNQDISSGKVVSRSFSTQGGNPTQLKTHIVVFNQMDDYFDNYQQYLQCVQRKKEGYIVDIQGNVTRIITAWGETDFDTKYHDSISLERNGYSMEVVAKTEPFSQNDASCPEDTNTYQLNITHGNESVEFDLHLSPKTDPKAREKAAKVLEQIYQDIDANGWDKARILDKLKQLGFNNGLEVVDAEAILDQAEFKRLFADAENTGTLFDYKGYVRTGSGDELYEDMIYAGSIQKSPGESEGISIMVKGMENQMYFPYSSKEVKCYKLSILVPQKDWLYENDLTALNPILDPEKNPNARKNVRRIFDEIEKFLKTTDSDKLNDHKSLSQALDELVDKTIKDLCSEQLTSIAQKSKYYQAANSSGALAFEVISTTDLPPGKNAVTEIVFNPDGGRSTTIKVTQDVANRAARKDAGALRVIDEELVHASQPVRQHTDNESKDIALRLRDELRNRNATNSTEQTNNTLKQLDELIRNGNYDAAISFAEKNGLKTDIEEYRKQRNADLGRADGRVIYRSFSTALAAPREANNPWGRPLITRDSRINGGVSVPYAQAEAVLVDFDKDTTLLNFYNEVKTKVLDAIRKRRITDPVEINRLVFEEVRKAMPYTKDLKSFNADIERTFGGRKINLGYFLSRNEGVCRHQALLHGAIVERLIDEGVLNGRIGVDRGMDFNETSQDWDGHQWVRYTTSDGKVIYIDPAHHYIGTDPVSPSGFPYLRPGESNNGQREARMPYTGHVRAVTPEQLLAAQRNARYQRVQAKLPDPFLRDTNGNIAKVMSREEFIARRAYYELADRYKEARENGDPNNITKDLYEKINLIYLFMKNGTDKQDNSFFQRAILVAGKRSVDEGKSDLLVVNNDYMNLSGADYDRALSERGTDPGSLPNIKPNQIALKAISKLNKYSQAAKVGTVSIGQLKQKPLQAGKQAISISRVDNSGNRKTEIYLSQEIIAALNAGRIPGNEASYDKALEAVKEELFHAQQHVYDPLDKDGFLIMSEAKYLAVRARQEVEARGHSTGGFVGQDYRRIDQKMIALLREGAQLEIASSDAAKRGDNKGAGILKNQAEQKFNEAIKLSKNEAALDDDYFNHYRSEYKANSQPNRTHLIQRNFSTVVDESDTAQGHARSQEEARAMAADMAGIRSPQASSNGNNNPNGNEHIKKQITEIIRSIYPEATHVDKIAITLAPIYMHLRGLYVHDDDAITTIKAIVEEAKIISSNSKNPELTFNLLLQSGSITSAFNIYPYQECIERLPDIAELVESKSLTISSPKDFKLEEEIEATRFISNKGFSQKHLDIANKICKSSEILTLNSNTTKAKIVKFLLARESLSDTRAEAILTKLADLSDVKGIEKLVFDLVSRPNGESGELEVFYHNIDLLHSFKMQGIPSFELNRALTGLHGNGTLDIIIEVDGQTYNIITEPSFTNFTSPTRVRLLAHTAIENSNKAIPTINIGQAPTTPEQITALRENLIQDIALAQRIIDNRDSSINSPELYLVDNQFREIKIDGIPPKTLNSLREIEIFVSSYLNHEGRNTIPPKIIISSDRKYTTPTFNPETNTLIIPQEYELTINDTKNLINNALTERATYLAECKRKILTPSNELSPKHIKDLASSGISQEEALKLGIRTSINGDSIVFPYYDSNGVLIGCTARLDQEAIDQNKYPGTSSSRTQTQKYVPSSEVMNRLFFPKVEGVNWSQIVNDLSIPIIITEGEKKAILAIQANHHIPTLSMNGTHLFFNKGPESNRGRNSQPSQDYTNMKLKGRMVYICNDSDKTTNRSVYASEERLAAYLHSQGAIVKIINIPPGTNPNIKIGLDDYLVKSTDPKGKLEGLINQAVDYTPPQDRN